LSQDPRGCFPELTLTGGAAEGPGHSWRPRRDLLASGPDDRHFVVEMDEERVAWLRFGDGVNGRAPEAGQSFRASYRSGSGISGNVAAEAIRQIVFRNNFPDGAAIAVRNPLPARGGTRPEPVERAKLRAPHRFRTALERAIAPDDYAAIVMRDFPSQVQRATAHMRASGAAVEVQVAIDAYGGEADSVLLSLVEEHLEQYRRIGHDVRAIRAKVVPLLLELTVCVRSAYLRGHVKAALQSVLGAGSWPGGRGLFHVDAMTFGDRITISRIAAAAHKVEGVASILVTRLERMREGRNGEVEAGELALGPFEVGRLDNDLRFPENGALILNLRGGR
jgi:predicted phage baseplate assembly protein